MGSATFPFAAFLGRTSHGTSCFRTRRALQVAIVDPHCYCQLSQARKTRTYLRGGPGVIPRTCERNQLDELENDISDIYPV